VPARPNILLITLDTTRADHLGAYGDRRARTPNLDRLAAGGVLFERAISAAPLTLPAHVSIFTGTYPFAHGVRNNGNFTLGDRVPTLSGALRAAGYRTAAFVSAFVLDRRYGLAAGFDRYDDRVELERRGSETAAATRLGLRPASDRDARNGDGHGHGRGLPWAGGRFGCVRSMAVMSRTTRSPAPACSSRG